MDLDEIKRLMDLLKDTDITDLQLEREGMRIRLRREKMFASIEMPQAGVPAQAAEAARKEERPPEESERLVTVSAPLVGTFYRAPSPEASPFVEVGDKVRKGQVVCIIEAMKLMNEIESEVDGVIVSRLVENAQAVEYGEPLFLIEPA
ncbi:MAG: acetyl-CoA carboxylase biotin carboxyl carrier protein [Nitrospirota bacterium]|jgi:acetyl-CoA carboxylase biotin carboxyl carrier protein